MSIFRWMHQFKSLTKNKLGVGTATLFWSHYLEQELAGNTGALSSSQIYAGIRRHKLRLIITPFLVVPALGLIMNSGNNEPMCSL